MIVKPKETTIAYRCPHCGGAIKSIVGVFALNAEMLKIKCPCKKSEMTIKYSSDKKIRITVPCFVCRTDHTYTVNESVIFSGEMFYLNCRYSGVDICFTGKEDEVAEEIDKTLDESAHGKHRMLRHGPKIGLPRGKDRDPLLCGIGNVDIVHADAVLGNSLQLFSCVNDLPVDHSQT